MFKLLAVDVDGTLVDEDLQISPRNRRALSRVARAGMVVTLATGRMFRSTLPFSRQLGIQAPLVTYNGALVKDPDSGEEYAHHVIPLPLAHNTLQIARDLGLVPHAFIQDQLCVESYHQWARYYEEIIGGVRACVVGDLGRFLKKEPTKIILNGSVERLADVELAVRQTLEPALHVTRSRPHFLEVLPPAVSKLVGLRALGRHLDIDVSAMVAVGDAQNDLEMLQGVGWGVAMGNAVPEVKAAADHVTAAVHEDGLALALEQLPGFGLGEAPAAAYEPDDGRLTRGDSRPGGE